MVQLEELKRLEDISALEHIAESVEALCISGCPKVKDFSVLEKLVNLRHLELTGRNEISSLSFFESNASDTDVSVFGECVGWRSDSLYEDSICVLWKEPEAL